MGKLGLSLRFNFSLSLRVLALYALVTPGRCGPEADAAGNTEIVHVVVGETRVIVGSYGVSLSWGLIIEILVYFVCAAMALLAGQRILGRGRSKQASGGGAPPGTAAPFP